MHEKPTPQSEAQTLLEAAERLEKRLPDLQGDIAYLRGYGHRSRVLIRALAVAGAALTLVFIAFVVTFARADNAYDRAVTVQDYQKDACAAGNESRTAQRELWAYVIDFSIKNRQEPVTAQQRRQLEEFSSYVERVFRDRDCARVETGGRDD